MLLNAAKCHGYCFYYFWGIKGEAMGRGKISLNPIPPRLGLNTNVGRIAEAGPLR